jgi:hypothetical protein
LLGFASPSLATTFTKISFSTNPATFYGGGPAINNAGEVAFVFNDVSSTGVFRGTGGPVTTIATSATPGLAGVVSHISINDSGVVAFSAVQTSGSTGLYTGSGGALTPIDSSANGIAFDGISINASGAVAYVEASAPFAFDTIYVGNGSAASTPVASTTGAPHASFGRLQMNDSGDVAFVSFLDAGGADIFTTGVGAVGLAIPNTDIVGINNSGQTMVVDVGGSLFIDTASGAPVMLIDGSIVSVLMASLNNNGDVAFLGATPGSVLGIFRGPDPSTDEVIAIGGTLFGRTVTSLSIWREALNDKGDIAFAYGLDNGETGIAVAHGVAEPSLASLLAAAGAAALRARRR